ncbi:MAG: DUF4175 domain-containing protein [Janthinobacterium lividum]
MSGGANPGGGAPGAGPDGGSGGLPRGVVARLGRKRGQARAVLWAERLWPAAWPAAALAGGYSAAALLGGVAMLPAEARAGLTLAVPAGVLFLLWREVRPLRAPAAGEVDRRLEAASGLRHHPLRVLADRPAGAGGAAGAGVGGGLGGAGAGGPGDARGGGMGADPLWGAHVARAAAQLHRLRVGAPRSVLAGRDLRALRGLVLVGLAASLVVAGPEAGPRLAAAFTPALPPGPPAVAPVLQAWITPPPSTGLPPVFLHPASPPAHVSVPQGSKLQVSLTGGSAAPTLALGGATQAFVALDPTSWQLERVLDAGGALSVRRGGGEVAAWSLDVVADEAPVVAWAAAPGPAPARGGAADTRTRLPWQVSHRYGVAGLDVELRLDARPGDAASVVAIPLPGAPKDAHGVAAPDLTANPWAGLAVTAVLVGRDGLGMAGRSEAARFTLPERAFTNPLARALIAARRRLTLDPGHREPVVGDLRGLADVPEAFGANLGVYLGMSTIASLLSEEDGPADAVAQAQGRLWEMALALDAGAVERTARVVEQAREQVRQALDAMKRDPGAKADPKKQAELKARVDAMRQAMKEHMQALLEQARRDGTLQPRDEAAQHMDANDLDKMLRDMEDAAKQGRVEDAERKMDELQKQMQALDDAAKQGGQQAQGGKGGKPGDKQDSERAQTAKDAVQDLLKREGGLLDTAQGRGKEQGSEAGRDPGRQDSRQGGQQAPGAGKAGPDGQDSQQGAAGPQPGSAGPPGAQPGGAQKGPQQQGQGPGAPAPGGAPGAGPPPGAQAAVPPPPRDAEGRVQRAMRRALGELMQQFGDSAGSVPKSLGDADQAMQQAEDALKAGHDDAARDAEQRAVADLRKGGQEMGKTMQRQFGLSESKDGKDGQQAGDGKGDDPQDGDGEGGDGDKPGKSGRSRKVQRDPLGRLTQDGGHGISDGDDVHVPDQAEQARSRDLQDELRRRGADRGRPQDELDYIGRLLKP